MTLAPGIVAPMTSGNARSAAQLRSATHVRRNPRVRSLREAVVGEPSGRDFGLGQTLGLDLEVEPGQAFGVESRADLVEHGGDLGGGLLDADQREDGLV